MYWGAIMGLCCAELFEVNADVCVHASLTLVYSQPLYLFYFVVRSLRLSIAADTPLACRAMVPWNSQMLQYNSPPRNFAIPGHPVCVGPPACLQDTPYLP